LSGPAEILIVEDEPKLASLLADYLRASGFATRTIMNGLEVEPTVRAAPPALVLLDLMLPGKDGLDICRDLRRFTELPIIMVTARAEEIDRLLGLQLGADDYICKPFSPREVVARVKAVLRRHNPATPTVPTPTAPAAGVAGLMVDAARYRAELDGAKLDLTPVEFRLLEVLASRPGEVHSRSELLDQLYGEHREVSDRTIDSHVRNLRRKLTEAAPDRMLLHSVYGVGYRLED
jgi:two-component system, OmpR family, response regulator BaeR